MADFRSLVPIGHRSFAPAAARGRPAASGVHESFFIRAGVSQRGVVPNGSVSVQWKERAQVGKCPEGVDGSMAWRTGWGRG